MSKIIEYRFGPYNLDEVERSSFENLIKEHEAGFKSCLDYAREVLKEPCKHEPFMNEKGELVFMIPAKCQKCGVELIARWEEKK